MEQDDLDVLIVGAGLSGISAAYHLQTLCPTKRYAILEARERLGGTWDLFRYPGIRSDSDMHTLGYSFRPWTHPKAIADGASILAYVRDTAEAYGIDRKIQYGQCVERASWSSETARWTVDVRDVPSGRTRRVTCAFLLVCAGYYDYEAGHAPQFEGAARFRGRIVHPQHWTPDVEYAGKRVVVVGSGATAVTLVPALAERAAHVTMLQRSPSYVLSLPDRDPVAGFFRRHLPPPAAYAATRWKNVLMGMSLYAFCRRFPARAKAFIVGQVRQQLQGAADADTHFSPTYAPWDQRMCLVPDGDLFRSIREGRASVVTDTIETFTETGLRLASGAELAADLVVTATGLKLKFLGGVDVTVDGARLDPSQAMVYKGAMCSDVPNLAVVFGYTNASWTLRCDLTAQYVCRLLNYMDAHGYAQCCPRRSGEAVAAGPLLKLKSGYVQRAVDAFPRQGSVAPWKLHQNYVVDRVTLQRAPIDDGVMQFAPRAG